MTDGEPRAIRSEEGLDAVLAEPVAVLYKHSPVCGLSARAARQLRAFMEDHPGVPVYMLDVIRDRPLARAVAERLDIRHESPQAFVIRAGTVTWHGSHGAVTAETLGREMDGNGG